MKIHFRFLNWRNHISFSILILFLFVIITHKADAQHTTELGIGGQRIIDISKKNPYNAGMPYIGNEAIPKGGWAIDMQIDRYYSKTLALRSGLNCSFTSMDLKNEFISTNGFQSTTHQFKWMNFTVPFQLLYRPQTEGSFSTLFHLGPTFTMYNIRKSSDLIDSLLTDNISNYFGYGFRIGSGVEVKLKNANFIELNVSLNLNYDQNHPQVLSRVAGINADFYFLPRLHFLSLSLLYKTSFCN